MEVGVTTRASNAGRRVSPVRGRRVDDEEWTLYPEGAKGAARALGINSGNVTRVCMGTRPTAHGYVFEYAEPAVLPGERWRDIE